VVDRAALIKTLEPCVRPTGSQSEAIRKALDKALSELIVTLPFEAFASLSDASKSDLAALIEMLDQKTCEKLSALWEPKRKLDAELKKRVKGDMLALIKKQRPRYEPVKLSLQEARNGCVSATITMVRSAAPIKDLKELAKSWDKFWKPTDEPRQAYEGRLIALLEGGNPFPRPSKGRDASR
jgi:hypothetical protein